MHDNYTLIIHTFTISTVIFQVNLNQATMPVPSQDKLGGCGRNSIWRKNGEMRHVGRWLVQMSGTQPDCHCVCLWYLPLQHKVHKKISSGTGSHRWSQKRAVKRCACVCVSRWILIFYLHLFQICAFSCNRPQLYTRSLKHPNVSSLYVPVLSNSFYLHFCTTFDPISITCILQMSKLS